MRRIGGAGVAPMPALIGPARPPGRGPLFALGRSGAAPLKPLFLSERIWRVHMRAYAAVCTCAYVHVRVNITAGLSVCRLTVGSLMASAVLCTPAACGARSRGSGHGHARRPALQAAAQKVTGPEGALDHCRCGGAIPSGAGGGRGWEGEGGEGRNEREGREEREGRRVTRRP